MATARYTLEEMLRLIKRYTPEEIVAEQNAVQVEFEDARVVLEREAALTFLYAIEREERGQGGWLRDPLSSLRAGQA